MRKKKPLNFVTDKYRLSISSKNKTTDLVIFGLIGL